MDGMRDSEEGRSERDSEVQEQAVDVAGVGWLVGSLVRVGRVSGGSVVSNSGVHKVSGDYACGGGVGMVLAGGGWCEGLVGES